MEIDMHYIPGGMRYDPLLQEGNAVVKLERNVDIDLLGCTNTSLFLTIDYDQGDEKTEFTCSECYLLFTSSTSLALHVSEVHSKESHGRKTKTQTRLRYSCPSCLSRFSRSEKRRIHVWAEHKAVIEQWFVRSWKGYQIGQSPPPDGIDAWIEHKSKKNIETLNENSINDTADNSSLTLPNSSQSDWESFFFVCTPCEMGYDTEMELLYHVENDHGENLLDIWEREAEYYQTQKIFNDDGAIKVEDSFPLDNVLNLNGANKGKPVSNSVTENGVGSRQKWTELCEDERDKDWTPSNWQKPKRGTSSKAKGRRAPKPMSAKEKERRRIAYLKNREKCIDNAKKRYVLKKDEILQQAKKRRDDRSNDFKLNLVAQNRDSVKVEDEVVVDEDVVVVK